MKNRFMPDVSFDIQQESGARIHCKEVKKSLTSVAEKPIRVEAVVTQISFWESLRAPYVLRFLIGIVGLIQTARRVYVPGWCIYAGLSRRPTAKATCRNGAEARAAARRVVPRPSFWKSTLALLRLSLSGLLSIVIAVMLHAAE